MRLNSSSYTTTYGIFIAQSEKNPKPPNSSSRNRRGLRKRDCSVSSRPKLPSHRYKPMHVFYRGGILASMVKQIMGLGNLIPCPNSFPKQVVAYLLFLLLPCKWKGWTWERMNREANVGFCCSWCQKTSYGPVSCYWECLSFPDSSSHHHLWTEPSVVGEHVEHSRKWKSTSSECPRLEQPISTFSRKRQNRQSSCNIPHKRPLCCSEQSACS